MSLIEWQEDYGVGVKEFDDQHKKMFDLINGFFEAMKESKDRPGREELLRALVDYGQTHLATEEKYFDRYGYPRKEEHKKAHDSYRSKIGEFVAKKDDALLSFEIIDFLEDWWLGHITSLDREYKEFFRGKGVK